MFYLIKLNKIPILQQLQIEEALLRTDHRQWCLINTQAPDAIVMGISGKPQQLLNFSEIAKSPVPVIRRYSGGGTVYIDPSTIFVSFIGNGVQTPKPLLEWSTQLYKPMFPSDFALQENDYVIGQKKIGGNAQYLQKGRWVHHTSFLWDYDPQKMACLLLPQRRPTYRADRSHEHFLTTLASHFSCATTWVEQLVHYLTTALPAQVISLDIEELLSRPHRQGTSLLNIFQDPEDMSHSSFHI